MRVVLLVPFLVACSSGSMFLWNDADFIAGDLDSFSNDATDAASDPAPDPGGVLSDVALDADFGIDPGCKPACSGRECGDDGCGGSCGTCKVGKTCEVGLCVPICGDTCASKGCACGQVCGISCGICPGGGPCSDGCHCGCVPVCLGRICGDDGCGGSCGTCGDGMTCSDGQCVPSCIGTCASAGCDCGEVCGAPCGSCGEGWICGDGCRCVCQPDCTGKTCGGDGCGGLCGTCKSGSHCEEGDCVPDCGDTCLVKGCTCGEACGESCGTCPGGWACTDGCHCTCVPTCGDRVCGDDGCGGQCGICGPGSVCDQGNCVVPCLDTCGSNGCHCGEVCGTKCGACPEGWACLNGCDCFCVATCEGRLCGDDGCGGSCGTCESNAVCKGFQCIPGTGTFIDNGDGTVSDPGSGLMWQKGFGQFLDLADAKAYCDTLALAGYLDWVLPDIDQLRTLIIGCPGTMPGGTCAAGTGCVAPDCLGTSCWGCAAEKGPGGDSCYLDGTFAEPCEGYWSETPVAGSSPATAFYVHFRMGRVQQAGIKSLQGVRCVRADPGFP